MRSKRVEEFMNEGWASNVNGRPIADRLWDSMICLTEGADYHRPFGFSAPQYLSYDEKWAFFYCPEVIERSTANLTDADFEDWLRYIKAHVTAHTRLEVVDEGEVDATVFLVMPEAQDLIGRVMNQYFEVW